MALRKKKQARAPRRLKTVVVAYEDPYLRNQAMAYAIAAHQRVDTLPSDDVAKIGPSTVATAEAFLAFLTGPGAKGDSVNHS